MIRADVHLPYFKKFLWIAIAALGYAAWSAYDGFIAYPEKLRIAVAYEALPDTEAGRQQWRQVATENGWPPGIPTKTAEKMRSLIASQFLAIVVCGIAATFLLLKWWRAHGTWIEGDESTFRNSRGTEFSLANLTEINRRKWEDKGIAVLKYTEGGKTRKFVLDDFKFDRENTGKLLEIAESKLPPKPVAESEDGSATPDESLTS